MKFALVLLSGAALSSMSLAAANYGSQPMQYNPSTGQNMYRDNYGNMYRQGGNASDQQMYDQYRGSNGYNNRYNSGYNNSYNARYNNSYNNCNNNGYGYDTRYQNNMYQNQYSVNQNQGYYTQGMNDYQNSPNSQNGVSDQELYYRVQKVLDAKKGNFYTGVNADVRNGVVILSGIIQSEAERSDLKSQIQKVNGVNKIDDQLYIRANIDKNLDQMLAQRAADALQNANSGNAYKNVQVSARDGVITLTGTVEQDYQKRDAQNKVMRINGVRNVDNQIKVDYKTTR